MLWMFFMCLALLGNQEVTKMEIITCLGIRFMCYSWVMMWPWECYLIKPQFLLCLFTFFFHFFSFFFLFLNWFLFFFFSFLFLFLPFFLFGSYYGKWRFWSYILCKFSYKCNIICNYQSWLYKVLDIFWLYF